MQKSLSVQDLEKINPYDYKENPEVLVGFAKQLMNIKKFEKAIEILEKAIHISIENNGKNEAHINCAKFYCEYADALIRKMMESEELFANQADEGENGNKYAKGNIEFNHNKPKQENSDNNIPNNNIPTNQNGVNEHKHEADEEHEEEEDEEDGGNHNEGNDAVEEESDEQIAFENLAFAERVYKIYLEPYDKEDSEKVTPEIQQKYFELAEVYQKFGELEMCKSDFKAAVNFYEKALSVRRKYDSKYSRAIAEIYFNMATVYDFDSYKCLQCFYKTKAIIEYHVKTELVKNSLPKLAENIIINPTDLDSDEKLNLDNIKLNKVIVETKLGENVGEELSELVDILAQIYQKIEDVTLDIKSFEKYQKEKEDAKAKDEFTNDYDKNKLVDLNSTGLIKKRQRPEESTDDINVTGKKDKPSN